MFATPFFPPSQYNPVPEMAPFFRVLDTAVAELTNTNGADRAARHHQRRSFTPRFDVREVGGSYELQGELPGMEQKDLEIEFVDDKTLVIRGRAERESEDGSDVSKKNDEAVASASASASAGENNSADATSVHNHDNDNAASGQNNNAAYHKASVEDEDGFVDAGAEANTDTKGKEPLSNDDDSTIAAADPATSVPEPSPNSSSSSEPHFKYWVRERSLGEFERRFAFPGRVDQEAVKASLRNGILSVVVPKIVEQGVRRVVIQ